MAYNDPPSFHVLCTSGYIMYYRQYIVLFFIDGNRSRGTGCHTDCVILQAHQSTHYNCIILFRCFHIQKKKSQRIMESHNGGETKLDIASSDERFSETVDKRPESGQTLSSSLT